MRILFANDGIGDAGGVQAYLAAVMPGLEARGHAVAFLHQDRARPDAPSPAPPGAPHFGIDERGMDAALADALAWAPDVAFVHNMRPLEVDWRLADSVPVVKFMHGYFGTCVSGQKAHLWPRPQTCGKPLGPGCLAIYGPRRCGQLRLGYVARQYRWANEQNELFGEYAAVVTASRHMRDEYVRNGAPAERVHALPLFPTLAGHAVEPPEEFRVAFLGRMTPVKGGDLLIRAVARAKEQTGAAIAVTMAGDGPRRAEWARLAASLGVDADFPGWVGEADKVELLRSASLLAVPSVWPEPFGLVGLEAGVFGVPSIAFDVGGIGEWLSDGVNGILVSGDPPTADALAAGLVSAVRHPSALRGMRAGARLAAERMSLIRHLDSVERVLAEAAGQGVFASLPSGN